MLYRLRRSPSRTLGERVLKVLARPAIKLALWRDPDPVIQVDLGRRTLWINWSHNLPSFLEQFPNYETEIGRLAALIHARCGRLTMVDVGANVGDTIALLPELPAARFLCVEGSRRYFDLLVRNFGSNINVHCVNALISDGEMQMPNAELVEIHGSAHLRKTPITVPGGSRFETLDAVIDRHSQFSNANFLKIDTDGFDFRVLKGAAGLLARSRPALHFELAFRFWEEVGETSMFDALTWLADAGYRRGILYDNLGFLIGADSFEKPVKLTAFRDYGLRRHDFYLNVVAFHESDRLAEEFLAGELERRYS